MVEKAGDIMTKKNKRARKDARITLNLPIQKHHDALNYVDITR